MQRPSVLGVVTSCSINIWAHPFTPISGCSAATHHLG
jgi:hypothetical protein